MPHRFLLSDFEQIFESRKLPSEAYRPAIEDNFQNHAYSVRLRTLSVEGTARGCCSADLNAILRPHQKASFKVLLTDELEISSPHRGLSYSGSRCRCGVSCIPRF